MFLTESQLLHRKICPDHDGSMHVLIPCKKYSYYIKTGDGWGCIFLRTKDLIKILVKLTINVNCIQINVKAEFL